jgi:hypothetical protein
MFIALPLCTQADELRVIKTCSLEKGHKASLLARPAGAMGVQAYLDIDGDILPAFYRLSEKPLNAYGEDPALGADDAITGDVYFAQCVAHTLIFMLDVGQYPPGIAIRFDDKTKAIERIRFAERTFPQFVYLGRSDWLLAVPKTALHTGRTTYSIYRYYSNHANDNDSWDSDKRPKADGYSVHQLYFGHPRWK